jgi:hypothetical protein
VEDLLRRRVLVVHGAIVVVILVGMATALGALRTATTRAERARRIDEALVVLHGLRADAREMGLSARRYIILGGDHKERLRIQAIVAAMHAARAKVGPQSALPKHQELDAALDEYTASLSNAIEIAEPDTIARLSHFEDELVRVRAPLSSVFDDIVSRERTARQSLRSADRLIPAAQWAVLAAGVIGIVSAIMAAAFVLRTRRTVIGMRTAAAPASQPPAGDEPAVLH